MMRNFSNRCRHLVVLVLVGTLGLFATSSDVGEKRSEAKESSADAKDAAATPPDPKLSSDFPHLVSLPPAGLTPEQRRPWFDTFSWQEFIALNWPVVEGQRGVPKNPNDSAAYKSAFAPNADGNYPQVVWGSWKQAYELFEQGSERPTPWPSFSAVLPCLNPLQAPPKTFLDATSLDINQSFSFPLIDQAQKYTRYEIRLNEAEYNFVRGQDGQPTSWLYITTNLFKAPVTFPISTDNVIGAVEVKAAWKPMMPKDDMKRYYVVNALVLLDPQTNRAQYQKMGLVGFHIAHKTSPFSEWVWSTFEQVDNVTPPKDVKPSFNNGTAKPPTPGGFDKKPPLFKGKFEVNPDPVQVTRVNAIPQTPLMLSTVALNAAFQKVVGGTVWQNYQLIATQWPTMPGQFKAGGQYPVDCGTPFPNDGVANVVIETYDQAPTGLATGNSCMSCHYVTAITDFSWVLADRSHITVTPTSQETFLANRFAPNRGLDALLQLKLGETEAKKAAGLLKALETLKATRDTTSK